MVVPDKKYSKVQIFILWIILQTQQNVWTLMLISRKKWEKEEIGVGHH